MDRQKPNLNHQGKNEIKFLKGNQFDRGKHSSALNYKKYDYVYLAFL